MELHKAAVTSKKHPKRPQGTTDGLLETSKPRSGHCFNFLFLHSNPAFCTLWDTPTTARPGNLCEPPRAAQKPLMTCLDSDERYKKPSKQSKNPKMPRDHHMETKTDLSAIRFLKRTPFYNPFRTSEAPRGAEGP